MKYAEIMEAPIGNLEVHGMEEPGSFSDTDRRLLTNPGHIQKIKKHFEKVPFDFDLYFMNQPDPYAEPVDARNRYNPQTTHRFTQFWDNAVENLAGQRSLEFAYQHFGIDKIDEGAITVIFLSNANEDNPISMTPWMVAHRFAHALDEAGKTPTLSAALGNALRKLPDQYTIIYPTQYTSTKPSRNDAFVHTRDVLTMRSARSGQFGDFRQELIAQYIMGGVKFVVSDKIRQNPAFRDKDVMQEMEKVVSIAGNRCNVLIDKVMDECVGQIFISP